VLNHLVEHKVEDNSAVVNQLVEEGVMPDNHVCLFCGKSIEQTKVDPCSFVFATAWRDQEFD
jgi:hypothetical protein